MWLIKREKISGGIIYRINEGHSIHYLLVTTSSSNRWIFPKGKVKLFEFKRHAAIRETTEESGIIANVVFKLKGNPFVYQKPSGKKQNVDFYAMECVKEMQNWKERGKRSRMWMTLDAAKEVLPKDFKRALEEVHSRLQS